MIITVTMNPAIDKTIETDTFVHGGLNRIASPITDAGGKGINVSKTIKAIGGKTLATGFLGKDGSEKILDVLQKMQIDHDFVFVEGITRTNMKIMENDGTLTEINEQGMTVSPESIKELIEKLTGYASSDTLFVLSGSIPKGVNTDIYAQITRKVKEKGAKVFVDADGELFKKSLEAAPSMIKPNHMELAEYFSAGGDAEEAELIEFGKKLLETGVEKIAVSRGRKGAIFITDAQVVKCSGLNVPVHSTVGAGDAMVAALSYAQNAGWDWENSIRLGMAASAGAVTTIGTKPPERSYMDELARQVRLEIVDITTKRCYITGMKCNQNGYNKSKKSIRRKKSCFKK